MMEVNGRSDFQRFLRSWIGSPLRVGAIAPSGASLARLITSEISEMSGPILELGAGTGVFTRALIDRGVDESDLTLVEYGSDFARLLDLRFPKARVLWMDAFQLTRYKLFGLEGAGAVISDLPLLSMPPRKVIAILSGAFMHLRIGGALYQFTYGPRCPIPRTILDRLGLKAVRIGGTMRNLPPAAVYRITRRCSFEWRRRMPALPPQVPMR
ncbi:MAG: class I SAM-dependent methyltransferase [Kiloniellaceae bacterium]